MLSQVNEVITRYFKVAGQVFSLTAGAESPAWGVIDNYGPFATESQKPVFSLEVAPDNTSYDGSGKNPVLVGQGEPQEPRIDLYKRGDEWIFEVAPLMTMPPCGAIVASHDFSKATLYVRKCGGFCLNNAMMLLFAFRTAPLGILEMHASVTVWNGKGYLFLGKSGTGKSTHSRQWLEYIPGSWLLNDDNPIVGLVDGVPTVFGSPWSGKTPCYKNESAPIGAIVKIRQSPENKATRLSAVEAYALLYSSTSGLKADKSIADGLHGTFEKIAVDVPSFILDCRPDRQAALVCKKAVTDDD